MSVRQLTKEFRKAPKKALFLFPQEMKTGIASTRLIKDNDVPLKQGSSVTVNWGGKKVQAEILALHGKSEFVLTDIQAFQNEKSETHF